MQHPATMVFGIVACTFGMIIPRRYATIRSRIPGTYVSAGLGFLTAVHGSDVEVLMPRIYGQELRSASDACAAGMPAIAEVGN